MRFVSMLVISALLAVVAGCEQRGPFVYVLDSPQAVELKATASASTVRQGETVVLHVERRTTGNWRRISRSELKPGQCWVYRPPVAVEPEVAHSIQWVVEPEGAVAFHPEIQLDQSRLATMTTPGTITLTPVSTVKCEEGRTVEGPPIQIEVT